MELSGLLQVSASLLPGNKLGTFKQKAGWDPRTGLDTELCLNSNSGSPSPAFLKLWSADHKWSSGSALVVVSD